LTAIPLVVDLDGTLIRTDMLHESALKAVRERPLDALRIPVWLARGKAILKQHLAQRADLDASLLPYNKDLVDWLRGQRDAGRTLVLCTASDRALASAIAEHLNLFDVVMASDGAVNLAGKNKAMALEQRFGERGFDYVGNSSADLHVWNSARRAIVVDAPKGLAKQASSLCEVEREFTTPGSGFTVWRRTLRVHQWLKNILLFVPLFASHHFSDVGIWQALALAFLSFSLCASSVYIANDLTDLESDRQHPRKSKRPFAAGALPVWKGVIAAPLLLLASLAIGTFVGNKFLIALAIYFLVTCAYSWGLKRLMLVDCLTLAVLYTMRIVAGAAASGLELSFWLLAFSGFLFLSLAFVKRYAELQLQLLRGKHKAHGRAYVTSDASLIQVLGVNSGFAAVVVLALYFNNENVLSLYHTPELAWVGVPIMLFWISWVWIRAHRGEMHDDPVIFAVKDRASLIAGALFGAVLMGASAPWPW